MAVAAALAAATGQSPADPGRLRPVETQPRESVALSNDTAMPEILQALTDSAAGAEEIPLETGARSMPDSLVTDTSRQKVSPFIRQKVDLEQAVNFSASDSLVLVGNNKAYMFGNSTVKYGEIDLNAGRIEMDMDSSIVFASASVPDSVQIGRAHV